MYTLRGVQSKIRIVTATGWLHFNRPRRQDFRGSRRLGTWMWTWLPRRFIFCVIHQWEWLASVGSGPTGNQRLICLTTYRELQSYASGSRQIRTFVQSRFLPIGPGPTLTQCKKELNVGDSLTFRKNKYLYHKNVSEIEFFGWATAPYFYSSILLRVLKSQIILCIYIYK